MARLIWRRPWGKCPCLICRGSSIDAARARSGWCWSPPSTNPCRFAPPGNGRDAAGKVVVSEAEVRETRVIDSDREDGHRTEQRNFANIVYEYSVGGQKLRNNRVSIGEDLGNFQVAETIAKYPVGAIVTVYYNPRHPKEAVLERDLPKGLWGCLGIGTAIVLAIVFGSAFGLNKLSRIRRRASRRSQNVAAGDRLRRVRLRHRAVRARIAEAGAAGEQMAGRARHDQAVGPRAIPRRAQRRRAARGTDDVSAQGVLHLQLQEQSYTNVHASLASNVASSSDWLMRLVHDGLSGRRAASRSGSIPSIRRRRRSNRAHRSRGSCGCWWLRLCVSGSRTTTVRSTRTARAARQHLLRPQRRSISTKIRASRSAHAFSPAWSEIRSWRISIPVFIRPRASAWTGMV